MLYRYTRMQKGHRPPGYQRQRDELARIYRAMRAGNPAAARLFRRRFIAAAEAFAWEIFGEKFGGGTA